MAAHETRSNRSPHSNGGESRPLARLLAQELPQGDPLPRTDTHAPRKRPLILAPHGDLHAAAVCWGLMRNGISPLWSASLAEDVIGPISLHSDGHGKWRMGGTVAGSQLSTVWFRRPRKPQSFPRAREDDVPCLRREWSEFHDNIYALCHELSDTLWINPPAAAFMTENKIVQLHAARQCGLSYPETLVGNDPDAIRSFIARHGRAIYKSFSRYTWNEPSTGKTFAVWAHLIDSGMPFDDDAVALCPGIYQAYIEKKHDLRVTAIGERLFTIRIAPAAGDAPPDWRPYALGNAIRIEACALPHTYEGKLRLLMRKLDLAFGCIDLVVDAEGEIHFLEVNQSGDFLFAEERNGSLPLLQAMCAMLTTGRVDYSLDAATAISYRDYLASDAHHEWRRAAADDARGGGGPA